MEKAVDFFGDQKEPPAIVIDSCNDHRIAMAFSIMGHRLVVWLLLMRNVLKRPSRIIGNCSAPLAGCLRPMSNSLGKLFTITSFW